MKNMAPATADLLRAHPLIEEILDSHREHSKGDERGRTSYRGDAYRMLNVVCVLVPDHDDKLAPAATFHDTDVFSSLNYLEPSIGHYLGPFTGRGEGTEKLAVVAEHHRLARTVPHAIMRQVVRHPLDPVPIVRARQTDTGRIPSGCRRH